MVRISRAILIGAVRALEPFSGPNPEQSESLRNASREIRAAMVVGRWLTRRPRRLLPLERARRMTSRTYPVLSMPAQRVGRVVDLAIPTTRGASMRARLFEPTKPDGSMLIWYHGGGFVWGGIESHHPIATQLCALLGTTVLLPEYRKAPEHPHPVAIEDARAAYTYVSEHARALDIDRTRIVVGGDSAGGNLAAYVALRAHAWGAPAPALQWLVCPWLDLTCTSPPHLEHANNPFLSQADLHWFRHQYLGDRSPDDPDVSPVRATIPEQTCGAVITISTFDPLRDDGVVFASRLQQAGVDVELAEFPALHDFPLGAGGLRSAHAAWLQSIELARARWPRNAP